MSLQADQIDMIKRISETQGVSRKFYLSFPYEAQGGLTKSPSLDDIRRSLNRQARSIASSMEACGNSVLSSDDRDYILDALYGTMCKGASMSMPYEFRKEDVLQNYYEQARCPGRPRGHSRKQFHQSSEHGFFA